MRIRMLSLPALMACSLLAAPARAVTIEWVAIGPPGNAPDTATNCDAPSCGAVPYAFEIGKLEVTNAQYAEFLNAVADADPNALYNPAMASDARGGINRSGGAGSYSYVVKGGRANNPVVFVSFWDALRFANWLHNGQPAGAQGPATTEDGAYTMTPEGVAANSIVRNDGAAFVVPTENEWYKAAYYDPVAQGYWEYPTGSDTAPGSDPPPGGANSANYYDGTFALTGSANFNPNTNYLSNAGAYTSADSPFGTFDQGGNVAEWNERILVGGYRRTRGGSWDNLATNLAAPSKGLVEPAFESDYLGFRVAVPEPGAGSALAAGILAGLAARRQRTAARATAGR